MRKILILPLPRKPIGWHLSHSRFHLLVPVHWDDQWHTSLHHRCVVLIWSWKQNNRKNKIISISLSKNLLEGKFNIGVDNVGPDHVNISCNGEYPGNMEYVKFVSRQRLCWIKHSLQVHPSMHQFWIVPVCKKYEMIKSAPRNQDFSHANLVRHL